MIVAPVAARARDGESTGARTQVSPTERRERFGQSGAVVWVRGATADQSAEIGYAAERRLFDLGRVACVVDPGETGVDVRALDEVVFHAARAGFIVITWSGAGAPLDDAESRKSALAARGVRDFIRVVAAVGETASSDGSPGVVVVSSAAAEEAAEVVVGALRERGLFGSYF
jgi:hypothetical protein